MAAIGIIEHNNTLWEGAYKAYSVFFYGDTISTTVTADPVTVSEWIYTVMSSQHDPSRLVVGLHVELFCNYPEGQPNPAATLQLCVGRRCLIYQLLQSPNDPQTLADFLSDRRIAFVGVGNIRHYLEVLQIGHGFGGNARYVDLRWLAAFAYRDPQLRNAGLRTVVMRVLGKDVARPDHVTLSRWDSRWLTTDQVKYACVTAFVSFDIGMRLNAWLYES